ncbi:MAG: hypothetical protein L6R39_001378 [Caloplaca ligustica]|nr:MAG: hypothetical protein L6R39_001378 [Caloplaca ligustica]
MTLLVLILVLSLPFCSALRCFRPPDALPARRDCRAIIAGIDWVSTRPSENYPRAWGRHLHTTSTTENLPKLFQIEGRRPPNLCAVEVDVDPLDIYAIDTFRLTDLTAASRKVYWECLMGKAMIGLEYPSPEEGEKKVWAKLVRLNWVPPLLRGLEKEELVTARWALGDGSMLVVREGGFHGTPGNISIDKG